MDSKNNHIYIGNTDRLLSWSGHTQKDDDDTTFSNEERDKAVTKVKELIKNYLQLDNMNFLFGTGASIHLGAAIIQNIPAQAEKDIGKSTDDGLKEDFKKYVCQLQNSLKDQYHPEVDVPFSDDRKWNLIYDGTYIRNYESNVTLTEGAVGEPKTHYSEILVMFKTLLNYLATISYQKDAENNKKEVLRVRNLISSLKSTHFKIYDVQERTTSERDLKRIREKGFKETFASNKYLFHKKFLKSLMQRPLNLQRANIFTSNYDLAFEYAFDNLGIKY